MKIFSGSTVIKTAKLIIEPGASVDNSGKIILKGNLENQNTSQSNLGSGTFNSLDPQHKQSPIRT